MKTILFYLLLFTSSAIFSQNYNFLGSYTADGTPLYFAPSDVVSTETLNLVKNSLPENYPVPTYNPQYISSGYGTDIIIDSLADVWVTFVSEGAGYRNVLGFYTYDINNPPTTAPTASQITIIFPNVSAKGSGGSLVAGNKVKIGTFQPGTGIGWVLLANAWNGSTVTNGLWRLFSNPNFNPEANPLLRQHNVLLNDPTNQRVILGFEDIRRDYSNCDQDFNDAIFYVTANPYEAIRANNLADVSSATPVTSGNNGGLESEGSLASLIAKRNFNRIKTNSFSDTKSKQKTFSVSNAKTAAGASMAAFIPTSGMFGTETTFVSSPTDLIGITNALEVYSVDYYNGTDRVAAVLSTKTKGGIYGHSKAICDRLNNSTLEDIRTINLNGFEIIMAKIKRANGSLEYALNFSVQQVASENKLHSYWNIGQYPTGDYTNFQVWGATMGQVSSITNHIISQYQATSAFSQEAVSPKIPNVFVKKGYYKNGQLHLKIINKSKATSVNFTGNKKATELETIEKNTQVIALTTAYEQDIVVETGGLFDIGFSIQESNTTINDALYLADGPWGLDYSKTETTIASFNIDNIPNSDLTSNQYAVERNTTVTGEVFGTLNVFRNILPGELAFDASSYTALGFSIQNSLAVEVVLVTENTTDWNNRLRLQIPAHTTAAEVNVLFENFTNPLGQKYNNEKIKGLVFSVQGNYQAFQPFEVSIAKVAFKTSSTLSAPSFENAIVTKMYNYPNPCTTATTLVLPKATETANVKIIDMSGSIVNDKNYAVASNNEIAIGLENTSKGIYLLMVTTKENESFQTKLIVN